MVKTSQAVQQSKPQARHIEANLIQRIQKKDQLAIGELYDLYGSRVFSLLLRMVRDRGVAEDLTQETFARVWTKANHFDAQRGSIGPWLLAISRNRALDHLRSTKNEKSAGVEYLERLEDPKLFAEVERSVFIALQIKPMYDALETLNTNQRSVIDLAFFEGYSQSEIASKLGRPIGTVKTWTRGALTLLRQRLDGAAL